MADTSTPLLLITNAGLAVASVAQPQGPYIHIAYFGIGSAYGYTPTANQTGIQGNLLYGGPPTLSSSPASPTSYQNIGNNTLNIVCDIPPEAGPWQFGEVALYLDDGTMFAIAVFDTPQTKFSSLGTNVISSYTLNCLIKLQQSTAVFQIDTTGGPPAVLDIYQWSDVYPPGISANPDVPLCLVKELNTRGDSSLIQNTSDAQWTLGTSYFTYSPKGTNGTTFSVAASSTSWVEVAASQCHTADLGLPNRVFVIRTADGFYRSVSSVVTSGSNYRFNLNVSNDGTYVNSPLLTAPPIGSQIRIYRADQTGGSIYYSQIVDPPAAPPWATVGTPGLAFGSTGLYMPSPGVIQSYGLLQAPSAGAGRILGFSDDLNNIGLPSGLYAIGGPSYPANMPVNIQGNLWLHNIGNGTSSSNGSDQTQIFFPWGDGGGSSGGNGGLPPYWRQGHNSGLWSNWQPFWVSNKTSIPNNIWTTANAQLLNLNGVGTYTFVGAVSGFPDPVTRGNVYSLPGLPGSWLAMSVGGTGSAGKDWLYLRVA